MHREAELSRDEEEGFPASHSPAAAFPGSPRGRQGATETPTGSAGSFTYFSPPTNKHKQLAPALNVTPTSCRRLGAWERTPLRPLTLRPLAVRPLRPGWANHGRRRGPRAQVVGMDRTSLRVGPPTSGARPAVGVVLVGPRWGGISHKVGAGAKPPSAAPHRLRCQNFPLAPALPQMSGLAHSSPVSPT